VTGRAGGGSRSGGTGGAGGRGASGRGSTGGGRSGAGGGRDGGRATGGGRGGASGGGRDGAGDRGAGAAGGRGAGRGQGAAGREPGRDPRAGGRRQAGGAGAPGQYRSARAGAAPRRELGGEQVEGRQAVLELLKARKRAVREVVFSGVVEPAPILDAITAAAEAAHVPVRILPKARFDELAITDAPQGVFARADGVAHVDLDDLLERPRSLLLALDGVTDPHNLGAILRVADGAGVAGVILPRNRSVLVTPTVMKAAAGAVEHVPMALVPGIATAVQRAKDAGVWVIGLDERGGTDVFALDPPSDRVLLVLGAEGAGLARLVRERCDVLARIPMRGKLASLNVATAGALVTYLVADKLKR
jgi:23S rRNA (guanosine2251-2'-O)-methyltransferase